MNFTKLAKIAFWGSVAGIVHTHVGYPLTLRALSRLRGEEAAPTPTADGGAEPPLVSLVIAAFDEEEVIEAKLANALELDYPRERLEVIVASDGSGDATVERARAGGADVILDLPRGGKMAAQNAAVERARGEIVAFSDANSVWEPASLRALVAAFEDPRVGYAAGRVEFVDPAGDNEEGAYWRLENSIRELESGLGGITAGNGAIYAVRRNAYRFLPASRSHDLSFPFELRRDGWRSVDVAGARASEKMVPSIEGEFARKRRMMIGLPDIVIADRMWDLRGYGLAFGYEIVSHRLLRYASPFLHLKAFAATLLLLRSGRIYRLALAVQLGLLALAALPASVPLRVAALARYYVLVTASIALGFWDRRRQGPPAAWEKSEGTR
jgi:cellulose synthase/poly-beta-1,6-N-acetylglucosamine synthase-like glycosyltransferase